MYLVIPPPPAAACPPLPTHLDISIQEFSVPRCCCCCCCCHASTIRCLRGFCRPLPRRSLPPFPVAPCPPAPSLPALLGALLCRPRCPEGSPNVRRRRRIGRRRSRRRCPRKSDSEQLPDRGSLHSDGDTQGNAGRDAIIMKASIIASESIGAQGNAGRAPMRGYTLSRMSMPGQSRMCMQGSGVPP